jgi:hypothetical protein
MFGFLALAGLMLGSWVTCSRSTSRLASVEFQRPDGVSCRAEEPQFLAKVEAWYHAIEGPSLRQRVLRRTGRWIESGLRQPDYEVTLVYCNGQRDEIAVWVYAEDYVPVYLGRWSGSTGGHGYSCLARGEPFTVFAQSMRGCGGSEP